LFLKSVIKLITIAFMLQYFNFNLNLIIPNLFHRHYNFNQIHYLFPNSIGKFIIAFIIQDFNFKQHLIILN